MDFLHEDPAAERDYIKRLMKHKQLQCNPTATQLPRISRTSSATAPTPTTRLTPTATL
jgi:hypothetical protein